MQHLWFIEKLKVQTKVVQKKWVKLVQSTFNLCCQISKMTHMNVKRTAQFKALKLVYRKTKEQLVSHQQNRSNSTSPILFMLWYKSLNQERMPSSPPSSESELIDTQLRDPGESSAESRSLKVKESWMKKDHFSQKF